MRAEDGPRDKRVVKERSSLSVSFTGCAFFAMLKGYNKKGRLSNNLNYGVLNNLRIAIGGQATTQQPVQSQSTFADLFTGEAANAYAATSRALYAKKFREAWQKQTHLERLWQETVELFSAQGAQGQARVSLGRVLEEAVLHGHIRILDLNPTAVTK